MYITGSLYALVLYTHTTPVPVLILRMYLYHAHTHSRCTGIDRYFIVISTVPHYFLM